MVAHVAAKLIHSPVAAVGSKVGKEAKELCASGQCAAAAVALKLAVDLGHLPSRALLAHMMLDHAVNRKQPKILIPSTTQPAGSVNDKCCV